MIDISQVLKSNRYAKIIIILCSFGFSILTLANISHTLAKENNYINPIDLLQQINIASLLSIKNASSLPILSFIIILFIYFVCSIWKELFLNYLISEFTDDFKDNKLVKLTTEYSLVSTLKVSLSRIAIIKSTFGALTVISLGFLMLVISHNYIYSITYLSDFAILIGLSILLPLISQSFVALSIVRTSKILLDMCKQPANTANIKIACKEIRKEMSKL